MMDGTAKASDYPAGIVCWLIKWQIVTQEMCICLLNFLFSNLLLLSVGATQPGTEG